MSLAAFESFDGADIVAFAASVVIGCFFGTFAPAGPAAIFTTVLVSYHTFLAWLVFFSKGHKQAGVSLPVGHTVLTHAACLFLIMSPIVAAVAKHVIPTPGATQIDESDPALALQVYTRQQATFRLVQVLCGSIAGMAVFERRWLFSSEAAEERQPLAAAGATASATPIKATPEDAAEWSRHLAQRAPGSYKAGGSLKAEYEQWLVERYKSRGAAQGTEDARTGGG